MIQFFLRIFFNQKKKKQKTQSPAQSAKSRELNEEKELKEEKESNDDGIDLIESQSLEIKAEKLESALDIKDRKYRFKTYKSCFIGSDAVKKIIELGFALNVDGAVYFGNQLIHHNIIEHVIKDHLFKNKKLYYRFTKYYYDKKEKRIK